MSKFLFITISSLLFASILLATPSHEAARETARQFLKDFRNNDAEAMQSRFNETVKQQLPIEQTAQIWGQITSLFGKFLNQGEILSSDYNGFVICSSLLSFENGLLEAKITIDKDNLISGFFISPKEREEDYIPPKYADTTQFAEIRVRFGEEPFILNGAISLPKSQQPSPAVVLIHGSGPHDMDESIGPNKPFKDIAWGLASNGIAVFRFNKRTKQYPEKMMEIFNDADVYDEVIYDAVYAVNLLIENAALYNIDVNKIYVLGHSLGGTLVPRIAREQKAIAGIISLAGMSRKLENTLLDQYNYLFSLDGEIDDEEKAKIEELKIQIDRMLSPNLSKDTPSDSLPLSMPAKYWMTFKGINPAKEASELDTRILIMQGARDYQVTLQDFDIWKNALKNHKKADFLLYEDLNHLLQTGEGKSKPDEYYRPTKVDERVVEDIIKWIKK